MFIRSTADILASGSQKSGRNFLVCGQEVGPLTRILVGKNCARQEFRHIRGSGVPRVKTSTTEAITDDALFSKAIFSSLVKQNNHCVLVQGLSSILFVTLPTPNERFELCFQ